MGAAEEMRVLRRNDGWARGNGNDRALDPVGRVFVELVYLVNVILKDH